MLTGHHEVSRVRTTATATALCVVLSALAAAQAGDVGVESIRADALKGHVYFLSAPEMGGRDSLSLEGRIAANYIAGFFYRLGLKPVGEGGTFFQPFPMSEAAIDRAQTRLRATVTAKAGGTTTARNYVLGSDFTLARQGGTDVDVTAPLVFAGYGIDAPEYGYNDYAGLDVAGKIVLVLSREPQAADSQSRFLGAWDTFHAYPSWKPEVARHRGAAGVLIVQGPPRRPQRVASGPTNGQVRTDRPNHSLTSPFWDLPVFTIDARVADDLLAGSGKTIADLQSSVDKAGRRSELAYQLAKRSAELKRDMESIMLTNQAASAGSAGVSTALRKTGSLLAFLKTNTDKGTGGVDPVYTSSPTATRTDSTSANQRTFTETILKSVVQKVWASGGSPKVLMVGPVNKQRVSGFSGIAQIRKEVVGNRAATIIGAADVYVSDFGNVNVVPNRFQRERDAFVLDPEYANVAFLRPFSTVQLAKTGDAEKRLILVEFGLKVNTEAAHGIAADLTTT